MKIGKYNRRILEFASKKRMTPQELKVLIVLSEVMWMSYKDIRHYVASSNLGVFHAMDSLQEKGLIKLTRKPNGKRGITKMYTIGQRGRTITDNFLKLLND